jgi:hypothetical protein
MIYKLRKMEGGSLGVVVVGVKFFLCFESFVIFIEAKIVTV